MSAGGNRWAVLGFATLPQLIPEFLSFTLYRFELAVRSASILGIVGAGGIGTPMILLSMHDLGVVWASFCLVLF